MDVATVIVVVVVAVHKKEKTSSWRVLSPKSSEPTADATHSGSFG